MVNHELVIPGRTIPKARPRFDPRSGRAYTDKRYADWLEMASATVAYTLRKPMLEGPLMVRVAFSPAGAEVAVMGCSPPAYKGRRGDIDNMAGSIMDALQQGGAIVNDRDVVRLETWLH